jgi:hypothetical protein
VEDKKISTIMHDLNLSSCGKNLKILNLTSFFSKKFQEYSNNDFIIWTVFILWIEWVLGPALHFEALCILGTRHGEMASCGYKNFGRGGYHHF